MVDMSHPQGSSSCQCSESVNNNSFGNIFPHLGPYMVLSLN